MVGDTAVPYSLLATKITKTTSLLANDKHGQTVNFSNFLLQISYSYHKLKAIYIPSSSYDSCDVNVKHSLTLMTAVSIMTLARLP